MILTLLSFPFTGFISCKMSTYHMTDLYNIEHDDIISLWLIMSTKQAFIILTKELLLVFFFLPLKMDMNHMCPDGSWRVLMTELALRSRPADVPHCPGSLSNMVKVPVSTFFTLHQRTRRNSRTGWTSLFCLPPEPEYNSPTWQNTVCLRGEITKKPSNKQRKCFQMNHCYVILKHNVKQVVLGLVWSTRLT